MSLRSEVEGSGRVIAIDSGSVFLHDDRGDHEISIETGDVEAAGRVRPYRCLLEGPLFQDTHPDPRGPAAVRHRVRMAGRGCPALGGRQLRAYRGPPRPRDLRHPERGPDRHRYRAQLVGDRCRVRSGQHHHLPGAAAALLLRHSSMCAPARWGSSSCRRVCPHPSASRNQRATTAASTPTCSWRADRPDYRRAVRTFSQVDVFSAEPLLGNPVAVVHGGDGIDDAQMAAFARWTNLSETTFLLAPTILPPTTDCGSGPPEASSRSLVIPPSGRPTRGSRPGECRSAPTR